MGHSGSWGSILPSGVQPRGRVLVPWPPLSLRRHGQGPNGVEEVRQPLGQGTGQQIGGIVEIVVCLGIGVHRQVGLAGLLKSLLQLQATLYRHIGIGLPLEDHDGQIQLRHHIPVGRKVPVGTEPGAGQAHGIVCRQPSVIPSPTAL